MKAPKCRLCHKEHYGLCVHSGSASTAKQSPGVSVEGRYEAKTPRPAVKSAPASTIPSQELNERAASQSGPLTLEESGTGHKSPDDIGLASEEKACETAALTPAEKQKAYRERNAEEKREANKLRMRRKRG